ncbi:MAG: hypothetical protein M3506_10945 [Chloroflexota bacterium]|nr:hypothetical protein [Chloroflexota bacterium]
MASVAAGAMLERDTGTAAANHTTQFIDANVVRAHNVQAFPDGDGVAIIATTTNQYGPAVHASNNSLSLSTNEESGVGVLGRSRAATGVKGESFNNLGFGVHGIGQAGVVGESSTTGYEGVYGHHLGAGVGVVGDAAGASSAGMLGRNTNATGDGVRGEGKVGVHGKSGTTGGNAVWGEGAASATGVRGSSASGYGGYFSGGKAPLRLALSSTAGKPTAGAHVKGEIYMDSAATLYVCTVAGTPGTWRRLTTTTA